MTLPRLIFCVVLGLTISGCSSIRQTMNGWLGDSPVAASEGHVFYAASAGLAVRNEASGTSVTIGRLSQYEKVTRTRLERGYAYVRSQSRDLEGWVDNAQLTWRLPQRKTATPAPDSKTAAPSTNPAPLQAPDVTPAPVAVPQAPPEPVAPQAAEPEAPPEKAPMAESPAPTPPPAVSEPPKPTKPDKARPEMFNPF